MYAALCTASGSQLSNIRCTKFFSNRVYGCFRPSQMRKITKLAEDTRARFTFERSQQLLDSILG